jgi:hypothetical protein
VVQSGDDPWDVITIGDTYPDGQLFGKTGGFFQPSTDFWFREGATVPEPVALALVGLAGLLVFARRYRKFLFVAGLLIPTLAQADTYYLQSYGGVGSIPWPVNPYGASVTVDQVSAGVYLVEDAPPARGQFHAMTMTLSGPPSPGGTNGLGTNDFHPSDFPPIVFTNGLWLQILTNGVVTNLSLRLHGTTNGDNYQLLSITNLLNTNWCLGQISMSTTTNDYMDLPPLPMTNAMNFYRVHHANPIMEIQNGQDSREPDSTNSDPGQAGIIYVENEGATSNAVTIHFSISGTAQNGVDYSNLTGVVTIPANQSYAELDLDPIADGLKPDETIILTLIQSTNYLIDPSSYSATNTLYANPEVVPIGNGDLQFPCPNTAFFYLLQARDPRGLSLDYTIISNPTHGTLTGTPPNLIYTPTNCYEGVDSFTFTASNGQFTSAPATVTLIIADPVFAYPVSAQTCRATPVSFTLSGSDNCGETLSYGLLSTPAHGTMTGTLPNLTYTPTGGTNFTGSDSFNFTVQNECGDLATNTVSITIGDAGLQPVSQTALTGTNRPVSLTLSAADSESCGGDTNYFTYAVVSSPAHGTLSGTAPHLTYTPTAGFEGQDSFNFTASDGVWTSSAGTVTVDVVAGPVLSHDCNPFGTAVKLVWTLDTTTQTILPAFDSDIMDFIIYRSSVPGSNYTAIATNFFTGDTTWMTYLDTNSTVGLTNYYVVDFETSPGFTGGFTDVSPFSNVQGAAAKNPDLLVAPDAFWLVSTGSTVTNLQAPFSSYGTNQYPGLSILPHTLWPMATTWSNHITIVIPTNSIPLSQVTYSIAIDNNYQLYLNDPATPIEVFPHEGFATWSPFKSFESVSPGRLHYGTNEIGVVITDNGDINYFSMIVSGDVCLGD